MATPHHATMQPRAKGRLAPGRVAQYIAKVCATCGETFEVKPSHADRRRFCSRPCYAMHLKGCTPWMKGKHHTPEAKAKQAAGHRLRRGPESPNWKGGYARTERNRDMQRAEYRMWRLGVFERDDYTCQTCGVRGGTLNAHHVKGWTSAPALRYVLSNGKTLCEMCHRNVHAGRRTI